MRLFVYLAAMWIAFCTTVQAEGRPTVINKGLICTSVEQVKEAIDKIAAGSSPTDVAGCGIFRAPMPIPVTAYVVEQYEHRKGDFILARFEFPVEIPALPSKVMYGWIGFKERAASLDL